MQKRGLHPYGCDLPGRRASLKITAIDVVGRQVRVAVRHPGEIDRTGSRIGDRDQTLGNSRWKGVFGQNRDGLAWRALELDRLPAQGQGRYPLQRVAILL